MALNEEEESRIAAIVEVTLKQYRNQRDPPSCAIEIDKEQHSKEHQFVQDLMHVACKLEKIKWGLLGSVVKTVGGIAIAALFIGIIYIVKQKTGTLP